MKHVKGRAVIKVDLERKNSHTFNDGTKIRLERGVENLNRRETQSVNAIIVSSENIPSGYEVLIHHNSTHEVNRIFDNENAGILVSDSDIKLFSIPESDCFLYRKDSSEGYTPCHGYATALRIFKPYSASMVGVPPVIIKNKLYITSGELKGKVCDVLKASDYEIIYQGDDDREQRIIRLRHFEKEYNEREEVICIDNITTKLVEKGELLIGLTPEDAIKIN